MISPAAGHPVAPRRQNRALEESQTGLLGRLTTETSRIANPVLGSRAEQWQVPRVLYLQGRVVTDTGEVPREPAVVKMRCGGRSVPQGPDRPQGEIQHPTGGGYVAISDRCQRSGWKGVGHRARAWEREHKREELRVAGRPSRVSVPSISRLDHAPSFGIYQVGTIVLYGHKGVTGETVSATTLMAPSSASKAYHKGLKALHIENPNYTLSIKHLQRAVAEYPDYAAAWASLAGSAHGIRGLGRSP